MTAVDAPLVLYLDWEDLLVCNSLLIVRFKQYVLWLKVCVGELKRVKKLDCIERLNSYFAHLIDVKAFVAIIFDEVVETLAERLEDEAHVAHHSAEALF